MHSRTRWTLSFATMILLGILSGCGGGASSSGDGNPLPAKTLSWAAPESYTDNTSLNPVTDLDGFEIYVNESGSFSDEDTPKAIVSAVDPATRTLTTSLQPRQSCSLSIQGNCLSGIDAGRRRFRLEVRFFPPASFSF